MFGGAASFFKLKFCRAWLKSMFSNLFGPRTSICKFFFTDPILYSINFLPNQRGKIMQTQKLIKPNLSKKILMNRHTTLPKGQTRTFVNKNKIVPKKKCFLKQKGLHFNSVSNTIISSLKRSVL